jgi:predicted NBD/HSP70 family sugar kinase
MLQEADLQVIGVDIGGTWMRAAVVHSGGDIGDVLRVPTARGRRAQKIVDDVVSLISRVGLTAEAEVSAVGIGVPTTVDERSRLDPCPNLPTMAAYPLASTLANRLGKPVFIENDASCFALGEWRFGAGRGANLLVGITLGTGIGLGVVVGGRLLRGAHGRAGEIWRSPANVECGEASFRNVEACVSGSALEDFYASATGVRLAGDQIARLADENDRPARLAFERLGRALENTLLWLSDLLDPDVIVLGGAVVASFRHFEDPVMGALRDRPGKLVTSELGDSAALYGAAMVAFSGLQEWSQT